MTNFKHMQNAITEEIWEIKKNKGLEIPIYAKIETTMTRLIAFVNKKKVAEVGVTKPEYFNYNAMLKIAKQKSGARILA